MAHGKVKVVNPTTGEHKLAPVGFSWTTLFFGMFPALFRLDWKNLAIMTAVILIGGLVSGGLFSWVALIVFGFIYNDKMYLKGLLDSGYRIDTYMGTQSLGSVGNSIGYDLNKFMLQQENTDES